jgi:hypothetical protein
VFGHRHAASRGILRTLGEELLLAGKPSSRADFGERGNHGVGHFVGVGKGPVVGMTETLSWLYRSIASMPLSRFTPPLSR